MKVIGIVKHQTFKGNKNFTLYIEVSELTIISKEEANISRIEGVYAYFTEDNLKTLKMESEN